MKSLLENLLHGIYFIVYEKNYGDLDIFIEFILNNIFVRQINNKLILVYSIRYKNLFGHFNKNEFK